MVFLLPSHRGTLAFFSKHPFHPVEAALEDLKAGRLIIVVDDENRENEGDLICAAQFATPQLINFMATEARGLICLAMQGKRLDELDIPLMVTHNTDSNQTAFTVSIDASPKFGVSTGISATDRSLTIQAAIHPHTRPQDLRRPGHIFPLRAREGGVLKRAGHTEAAVDLAMLAGLYPAGVICEIQNLDGSMARLAQLLEYSRTHDLKIITIASLIEYRLQNQRLIERAASASFPSEFGTFQVYAYQDLLEQTEHLALVKGDLATFPHKNVLVRVHTEYVLGDTLASLRSDSRRQLETALKMIEYQGLGVVVYLRPSGYSLIDSIKTYALQDLGLESREGVEVTGLSPELRNYGIGAQILRDLGVQRMRLLTNNPRKISGLRGFGLELVERVPLLLEETDSNIRYISTHARPAVQNLHTFLLTLALYPRSLMGADASSSPSLPRALWLENLRRITAVEDMGVEEDSRPIASAVFGSSAVVAHIGLEKDPPSISPQEDASHRHKLIRILLLLADSPELATLTWMGAGGGHPLTALREDLTEVCYPLQQLRQLAQQPEISDAEFHSLTKDQIIYHLQQGEI
ncbi:MAG: 3,4-dihydroxy-2-butanone-4-phosphate synthase [Synechococcaceae cyanobacterium SM2_3_1]|nr:3,4-dihydroxy-2-butanone-4-phosphate synthase [Synechococcaceae cyanobacterium SM2_3_1]